MVRLILGCARRRVLVVRFRIFFIRLVVGLVRRCGGLRWLIYGGIAGRGATRVRSLFWFGVTVTFTGCVVSFW